MGGTFPGKLDGGLDQDRWRNFRAGHIGRLWGSLFRMVSIVLEHYLSYLSGICNGPRLSLLEVAASHGLKEPAMNLHPEVPLQVLVGLCHVERAWQHQLFHQFNQAPVSAGSSNDQMKVGIPLNLPSIFFDVRLGSLRGFLDDSLKFLQ